MPNNISQITTHVLDTANGLPAENMPITLFQQTLSGDEVSWSPLGLGMTNKDGRITGLLEPEDILPAGIYRMHFNTSHYFKINNIKGFYPYVDVVFELDGSDQHYHIPLLLSAFGYSTYKGS